MILAELEVFHSRPIAPTRRVALGRQNLSVVPAPGFGGMLLAGIVANFIPLLDPDLFDDLDRLTLQLQEGVRIPQPRLRYRFQQDRVGLTRSVHQLIGGGEDLEFEFAQNGAAAQHILAAVYSAGQLPVGSRGHVMDGIRKGMRWSGALDGRFVSHLSGRERGHPRSHAGGQDPVQWALGVLDLGEVPSRSSLQHQFRHLLRHAHPDHGGDRGDAAQRIADLTEARRILLAS